MERKEFIRHCAFLCTTIVAAGLLEGCKAASQIPLSRSEKGMVLDKSSFVMERKGRVRFRRSVVCAAPESKFPVYVHRGASGNYRAFLMRCTHQGAELTSHGEILVCHAHGSEFASDGKVIQGPAEDPLTELALTEDQHYIYLKL
jgi:Rieske Fe-S protein